MIRARARRINYWEGEEEADGPLTAHLTAG
jgi:hypothetical protein